MAVDHSFRIAPYSTTLRVCRGAASLLTALTVLIVGGLCSPARADLIMQVDNATAAPGGTGAFDVVLKDTDPSNFSSYLIAGISVEVSVPGASGLSFTGVDTNTTAAPYIFGSLQSPPFSFSTFPTNDVIAS